MKLEVNKVETYTFTLDREEANMILAIAGTCSGWKAKNNIRVLTDKIFEELESNGLDYQAEECQKYVENIVSGLRIASGN